MRQALYPLNHLSGSENCQDCLRSRFPFVTPSQFGHPWGTEFSTTCLLYGSLNTDWGLSFRVSTLAYHLTTNSKDLKLFFLIYFFWDCSSLLQPGRTQTCSLLTLSSWVLGLGCVIPPVNHCDRVGVRFWLVCGVCTITVIDLESKPCKLGCFYKCKIDSKTKDIW